MKCQLPSHPDRKAGFHWCPKGRTIQVQQEPWRGTSYLENMKGNVFCPGHIAVTHQTKVMGMARRSESERTLGSFVLQSFHYINEEPESQTEKGRNPARGGISV